VFGFATAVADFSASFAAFSTWLTVVESLMMMVLRRPEKVALLRREGCDKADVILALGRFLIKGKAKKSNSKCWRYVFGG
jgi:hypothetical protein